MQSNFREIKFTKKVYKEGSCSLTEFFKIIKQTIKEGLLLLIIIIYEREMRKNTQQK